MPTFLLRVMLMARGFSNRLEGMVDSVIKHLGCELIGVEMLAQGRDTILRIYIENVDHVTAITVDDCERVSRQLSALFDVEEPLSGHYSLEVSSPGLDRLLTRVEHFSRFVGERARVRMALPVDGRRQFVGRIDAVVGERIRLELDDGEMAMLPFDDIDKARLVPAI